MSRASRADEPRAPQPLLAYTLPFAAYVLLTAAASQFGSFYPAAYCIAVLLVTAICILLLRRGVLKPHGNVISAVAVGVLGILLWISLSSLKLEATLASQLPSWLAPRERVGFNPFDQLSHPLTVWGFVAVRLFGLIVITPVAEELFWRGFLARWLISPDWAQVPLGKFSRTSFAIVTIMFTLAHPEWFAAAVYCVLLNALLYFTKDLWSCIVAHGVSNLLLAIYVMSAGAWWLW